MSRLTPSDERFIGEITTCLSFPVHYILQLDGKGELLILCYLTERQFPFAMWNKQSGLSAISFETYNTISTNGCLPPISEFCEQAHDAWCLGNQTGPADCHDCNRPHPPANGAADKASS